MACRAAPEAPPTATLDLLSRFPDVDCRSDTVDLPFLLSRSLLKHRGFEEARDPGTQTTWLWLAGREGRLELPFATSGPKTLRLTARCKVSQGPRLPVVVSLNGHVLATLSVTPEESEHRVDISADVQVPGRNELLLEAQPRAGRPPRPMMLRRLRVTPAGNGAEAAPLRSDDGLRLPSGATVRFPLYAAGPGVELEVAARGGPGGQGHLRVTLEGREPPREVAALIARAGAETRVRVPLPPTPHRFAHLAVSSAGMSWTPTLRLHTPSPPPSGAPPASPAGPGPARPNLVLYVADAVRADVLSAYGNPRATSPRFDAFARQGWLFEDATAQSASTRPSVASMLTGVGVDGHGVVGQGSTIAPALTTLAETLRSGGYATGAFVANDVLSPALGFARGFDEWGSLPRRPSAEVVRAALLWTRQRRGPFFLYVHTLGAHRPYQPAPEHWRPFLPSALPRTRDVNALLQKTVLSRDEMALVRSAYEGEIHEDDAAFGELLDGLQADGTGPGTVVAFTADHGEAFEEHGHRGHGVRLYQETSRVPLALRVPGTAGGIRVASPVQHIDLAPTFFARAGIPKPAELLGWDLARVAAGGPAASGPGRLLVSRLTYEGSHKVAVRWGTLKLIANEEPDVPSRARFELYDLARDPRETRNLAAEMPEAVEYLWMESRALRAVEEERRARVGAGRQVELSPEDKEALRALGYVE